MKLICFDMEGVIFRQTNFWLELHKKFGTYEKGKELTERFLHKNYNRLVEEVVVKLWKGKDAKPYFELIKEREYLPGVKETFDHIKEQNYITVIITGGPLEGARRVQKDFGINHVYGNELVIKDGKVLGEFIWPIGSGHKKKVKILKHLCDDLGIKLSECVCIADDKRNLELFEAVDMSIAFNSDSEELKKAATYVVDSKNLADVIPILEDCQQQ